MAYNSVPAPGAEHSSRGYGPQSAATDYTSNPADSSPLSQSLGHQQGRFNEDFDHSVRPSSIMDGDLPQRTASRASNVNNTAPSRSGTLKKKGSVSRKSSMKRSGSKRSTRAGSIKGVTMTTDYNDPSNENSIYYTPIPTQGSPTDILANRFQAWRKLLKDLITYFREVQSSYETRSKALMKVSNVINNTNAPPVFLTDGGLNEANRILRDYHRQSVVESNKAREVESDVITQLSGLRADLGNKIKEIKSLSGDFKNSVDKEQESTRKAITQYEDALAAVESDPHSASGKGDPYVVRLAVDRQVERQIDEENYLHRAYLNLEGSGRELESIVVGEIQKAYNALAGILKRDADEAYETVDKLRSGPIALPKDLEWDQFVEHDPHFVNPRLQPRRLEDIEYPGKYHPAAAEIRAGMLERKSKYLKSYTPGWYVLSPTHLHEFKSADRIYTQPPVMSLYLPDQKLGTHSQDGSSSHKFMLKGRQTGSMHRGHSWVFRAESHDTMLAWYEDIKTLTEKSGEERNAFVRQHARSVSAGSARSISSDGLEDNEADEVPYSAASSVAVREPASQRPQPGGRFPSDIQVNRGLQAPLSPSSGSSDDAHDLTTAAGGLDGSHPVAQQQYVPATTATAGATGPTTYSQQQYPNDPYQQGALQQASPVQPSTYQTYQPDPIPIRNNSTYGSWMAPAAGGAAAGALGAEAYRKHEQEQEPTSPQELAGGPVSNPPSSTLGTSTAPISYSTLNPEPAPAGTGTVFVGGLDQRPHPTSGPMTTKAEEALAAAAAAKQDLTPTTSSPPAATAPSTRAEPGAHATGSFFPSVVRHDTDVSISALHVPGEYPARTPAAR